MNYLYIFLLIVVLWIIYMRFEAAFVEVKHVKFTQMKDSLKILQLSDIHIHRMKVSAKRIRQIIENEQPDLIILTGDYIEDRKHVCAFYEFLTFIKKDFPLFLCLGNHDYKTFQGDEKGLTSYIAGIEKIGVAVLNNRSVCFEKNSKKYNIIGIEDMRYCLHKVDEAFKTCCSDVALNIAFSHNPDIALEIPYKKADYLFCGHFHGGQIWAPFGFEFKFLRNEKLSKMGMISGLYKFNGLHLYISRGLGNVCVPLRFLSRPEVTVFHLP